MSKKHKTYTVEFKAEAIKALKPIKAMYPKQLDNLAFPCKPFRIGIIKQRLEL
jgi:hypothetical protein